MTHRREMILSPRWAMDLESLAPLISLYEGMTAGDPEAQRTVAQMLSESRRMEREAAADRLAAAGGSSSAKDLGYDLHKGVARFDFVGIVTKERTCMGSFFGGDAVTTDLVRTLNAVTADESVRESLVRIDSPGGTVDGTEAAGEAMWRAAQKKPVTAYVDGMACSAAWWIASQATRVVGSATSTTASMGVYATVADTSRAFENRGVKIRIVKSARGKGAGAPGTQITDEQIATIQREVDAIAEVFIEAVARGRGISIEKARAMADGEPRTGAQAMELGFLDAIQHYGDTLDGLVSKVSAPTRVFVSSVKVAEGDHVSAKDISIPPDPPATSPSSVVVAHDSEPKEAPMSEPTITTAPPNAGHDADAQLRARLDALETQLAEERKRNLAAEQENARIARERAALETEALLKAHKEKFLPAEAHVAAARTIAASFPNEFALLMGVAKPVRPKLAERVFVREAGDGTEGVTKDAPVGDYIKAVDAVAAAHPGRSLVSIVNDLEQSH